jgi:hypothetical protein
MIAANSRMVGLVKCLICEVMKQVEDMLSRVTCLAILRCKKCRHKLLSSRDQDMQSWCCCYCGQKDAIVQLRPADETECEEIENGGEE